MTRSHRPTGDAVRDPAPAVEPWSVAGGRRVWLAVIPAILLYLFLAMRFSDHIVDDAYISFRYARNLAAGHGLVYNPGERVEGYTNFLWVLLLEVGMKLRQDPETVARVLGMLTGAATIAVVARLAARARISAAAFWMAPVFVAVQPANAVWAGGGLEGPLFACLLTAGVGWAAISAEEGLLHPASAVLLALAALTRPEGAVVMLVVTGLVLATCPNLPRRSLGLWGLVFLALWTPHFLWRWHYYGDPLPNTFYAKVDMGGSEIHRGLVYLGSFARDTGYWLLLPIAGVVFLRRRKSVLITAGVAAVYLGYVVFVGGDTLSMHRFFVPVIGLLGLLLAWGAEGWKNQLRPRPAFLWGAGFLMVAAVAWSARPNFAGASFESVVWEMRETSTWKDVGRWFGENAAPGDSIAVLPAGAIPYFSGLKTIDMLGLNDHTISHTKVPMGHGEAGHEKYNLAYVLRRSPTFVVVGVYALTPQPLALTRMVVPYYPIEKALLLSEEFRHRYRAEVAQTPHGYFVYFRRVG
jgi:arabinofuranosyltransferase